MANEKVLELDALAEDRQYVLIKTKTNRRGIRCPVRRRAELSLKEELRLSRLTSEFSTLEMRVGRWINGDTDEQPTDEELEQFESMLNELIELGLDKLPDGVVGQLTLNQKYAILNVFIDASTRMALALLAEADAEEEKESQKASGSRRASSSRGSKRSTGAGRKTGSKSRKR